MEHGLVMINFVFVRVRCGNIEFRLNCSRIDNNNEKVTIKVFFLGPLFLPEGSGIFGYREISKISGIYRTR
jgi:hypothetical protein